MMNTSLWVEVNNRVASEPGGELADNWTRIPPARFFEVETLGGTEPQTQGNSDPNASHKLKCHYFAGARPGMRLTKGDDPNAPTRIFNVSSVVNVNEENKFLIWQVSEVL